MNRMGSKSNFIDEMIDRFVLITLFENEYSEYDSVMVSTEYEGISGCIYRCVGYNKQGRSKSKTFTKKEARMFTAGFKEDNAGTYLSIYNLLAKMHDATIAIDSGKLYGVDVMTMLKHLRDNQIEKP